MARAGNVPPYSFYLPPTWYQQRIANILSGNYCQPKCAEPWIEVKFENPKQGTLQVTHFLCLRSPSSAPTFPAAKHGPWAVLRLRFKKVQKAGTEMAPLWPLLSIQAAPHFATSSAECTAGHPTPDFLSCWFLLQPLLTKQAQSEGQANRGAGRPLDIVGLQEDMWPTVLQKCLSQSCRSVLECVVPLWSVLVLRLLLRLWFG